LRKGTGEKTSTHAGFLTHGEHGPRGGQYHRTERKGNEKPGGRKDGERVIHGGKWWTGTKNLPGGNNAMAEPNGKEGNEGGIRVLPRSPKGGRDEKETHQGGSAQVRKKG